MRDFWASHPRVGANARMAMGLGADRRDKFYLSAAVAQFFTRSGCCLAVHRYRLLVFVMGEEEILACWRFAGVGPLSIPPRHSVGDSVSDPGTLEVCRRILLHWDDSQPNFECLFWMAHLH